MATSKVKISNIKEIIINNDLKNTKFYSFESPIEYTPTYTQKWDAIHLQDMVEHINELKNMFAQLLPDKIELAIKGQLEYLIVQNEPLKIMNSEHLELESVLVKGFNSKDFYKSSLYEEYGYFGATLSGYYFNFYFTATDKKLHTSRLIIGKDHDYILSLFCSSMNYKNDYELMKIDILKTSLEDSLELKTKHTSKTKI